GWCADRVNLKRQNMVFRIAASQADNVATEVQQLLAERKVTIRHLRPSIAVINSIVELEADVSHSHQQKIVAHLNRKGIVTEVIPFDGHHEWREATGLPESQEHWPPVPAWECLLRP